MPLKKGWKLSKKYHNSRKKCLNIKLSVEDLEGSKQKLLLGQLAFELDKALLGKVLEKSMCDIDELKCIEDMERAIKCEAPLRQFFILKMNPNEYASGGVNCKPSLAGKTDIRLA